MLYLNRFPFVLQQKIQDHLLIIKQDLHLDDPYPMEEVITTAKFLLTRSTFWSSLPPAFDMSYQPAPYQPPCTSLQPSTTTPAFNLIPNIKTEFNQAMQILPLCKFCARAGHFTCTCSICLEYLNSRKVVQGNNSRLYMLDGFKILQVSGGRCLKDTVDHILATRQSSQGSSTISSFGRARDPPSHITVGILSTTYPNTSAILDINLSAFVLTRANSDMESEPIPIVADVDFQLYIAQAWGSFQVDKTSKDKGKHIRFDGV